MEKIIKHFIIICVVFIFITLFLRYSLHQFNKQFNMQILNNQQRINNLPTFTYDIHFEPPPEEIDIKNPYACSPTDLHPCKVNDPIGCEGCQSLIATCKHFAEDATFIDDDGTEKTIPANETENDGWCWTLNNPTQACNPFHGNLVFVRVQPERPETMLFCECIYPGYIGKTTFDGNCETVFICDGKIEELNVPLKEMKCVCSQNSINVYQNDVPMCVPKKVQDMPNYDDPMFFNEAITVSIECFNETIANACPSKVLLNPCNYCLLTGKYIANGKMVPTDDEEGGFQCVLRDAQKNGLPIRRSSLGRLLKGTNGPDGIIDLKIKTVLVYNYISNDVFEQKAITFLAKDNIDFLTRLELYDDTKDYSNVYFALDPNTFQLVWPGSFGSMKIKTMPLIFCQHIYYIVFNHNAYYCSYDHRVHSNRLPKNWTHPFTNENVTFPRILPCRPYIHNPMWSYRYADWKHFEGMNSFFSLKDTWRVNKLLKLQMRSDVRQSKIIRYLFTVYEPRSGLATGFIADHRDMYDYYQAHVIPKDTPDWDD